MTQDIEKAKLFTVSGPIDNLTTSGPGITVLFNPTSLKVTLSNTLKDTERDGSNRATQFVDKSSSSLTVELIFDTSDSCVPTGGKPAPATDVRSHTGAIAREFMQLESVGDAATVPKRCMFAWGTFKFVGIMESLDETLDFFSPEGTPLRAVLAIKLAESRFQFISEAAKAAQRDTPSLSSLDQTGKDWRAGALFNGIESPRLSLSASVSLPGISASASLNTSQMLNLRGGGSLFTVGSSGSLGTGIQGAFSAPSGGGHFPGGSATASASASAQISGNGMSASAQANANASIGFD